MRHYILFSLAFVCFSISRLSSQFDVTANNKGMYGVYDSKKKWVLPATYTSLGYLPIYGNSGSFYLLGTDKRGSVIMETKGYKKICPIYEKIELIDRNNKLFIVKDKGVEYFYQIGKGILEELGSFDSHKIFPRFNNIYVLKKGNQSSIYNTDELSKTNYINGDIVDNFNYAQYLITNNNKYGIIDVDANVLIPLEYDTLITTSGTDICLEFIAAKKQNKWGIVRDNGNITIPLNYEAIDFGILRQISGVVDSCLHAFPVRFNGKWGFVNEKNDIVITSQYDTILGYVNHLKFLAIKNGKSGLIDLRGKVLFPFNYNYFERTNNFTNEYQTEKYYFVNNTCINCNPLETAGGWGIADSTGNLLQEMNALVVPLRNYGKEEYENFDSSNYGFLWNVGGKKIKTLLKVDTIQSEQSDANGEYYIVSIYDSIFSYNLIGGKTGIINNKGKIILPISNEDLVLPLLRKCGYETCGTYDLASLSQQSKAYASSYTLYQHRDIILKQNKRVGIVDLFGKQIIPCIYDSIQDVKYDRYDICEVSDSIQNTLHFPLEQYKCWQGGNIYFFTKAGQFLSKRLQKEQMIGELKFTLNPPNKGNYYFTPIFNLIALNPTPEFHSITTDTENEQVNELGEWSVINTKRVTNYYTPIANKFNFFNPLTNKYLFNELIEDFILIQDRYDQGIVPLQWSKTKDRIKIVASNFEYSSIVEKIDNNSVTDFIPNNFPQRFGRFDSIIFVKQNNKWYLRNLNQLEFRNKVGFDSVKLVSNSIFLGYIGQMFSSYTLKENTFDGVKINVQFPEFTYRKLVCSECEYVVKEKETWGIYDIYNENGEPTSADTSKYKTNIPYIKSGKLNLVDENYNTLINKWVDEIIFPLSKYENYNLNLSNGNDTIFTKSIIYDADWSAINSASSIAFRIKNEWYLTTLGETKKVLGPFENIIRTVDKWNATKSGVTTNLSIIDLSE